jgi:hypothetical protein
MNSEPKKLGDMLEHEKRIKEYLASDRKELEKEQANLRTFEHLAADATFGKYYLLHVEYGRARIPQLESYIARCQSRLEQIGDDILKLADKTKAAD